MKRVAALITAGVLAFGLAGCAKTVQAIDQGDPVGTEVKVPPESERQSLQITEQGFFLDGSGRAQYAVIVNNPNQGWAASMVDLKITLKDTDGKIIGSEDDRAANDAPILCQA